jgi:hypothetical protein
MPCLGLGQAPPSGQVSPLLKFFLGAYPQGPVRGP